MPLGFSLAHFIAAAMVVAALVGWARWRRLDRGGRWFVLAITTSVAFLPVAMWMMVEGQSTRLLHEGEMLVETGAILLAFLHWQPNPRRRRVVAGLAAAGLLAWLAAQLIQGLGAEFSYASAPIAGLTKVAAAAYTLVGRVQATRERWTDQLWFWATTGVMVIYGTGVILDPLWLQLFGVRDDLALAAFGVNVVGNCIGYLLAANGLWRAGGVNG